MATASKPIEPTSFLRGCELAPTIDPTLYARRLGRGGVRLADPRYGRDVFGWGVAMKDGRRLHLEYTLDDTENGTPEDLTITPPAVGET